MIFISLILVALFLFTVLSKQKGNPLIRFFLLGWVSLNLGFCNFILNNNGFRKSTYTTTAGASEIKQGGWYYKYTLFSALLFAGGLITFANICNSED